MNKEEILYNEIYERTKDFGRTHFIKEIMRLQRELEQIKEIEKEHQRINGDLREEIKELEFIVGLRQKRNLINKFDKEYDEEDKNKNPNRDYAAITPDAEEVYKRYYTMKHQQKEFIDWLSYRIDYGTESISYRDSFREVLQKYKEIIGDKETPDLFENVNTITKIPPVPKNIDISHLQAFLEELEGDKE